jgi:hypothetical protein
MKVICIDNKIIGYDYKKIFLPLTVGKAYEYAYEYDYSYIIKDDNGYINSFQKWFFMTLDEYRNQKLKEIGI